MIELNSEFNPTDQAFFNIVGGIWSLADRMKAALDDPAVLAAHDYYMHSNDDSVLAELAAMGYEIFEEERLIELRDRLTWRWALLHDVGPQAEKDRQTGISHGEA